MGEVVRLRPKRQKASPAGLIAIEPSPVDDGCWQVTHWSPVYRRTVPLRTFFSFFDADTFARAEARRLGADYAEDQGGAA